MSTINKTKPLGQRCELHAAFRSLEDYDRSPVQSLIHLGFDSSWALSMREMPFGFGWMYGYPPPIADRMLYCPIIIHDSE